MNINVKAFPYDKMRAQQKHILRNIDANWNKRYIIIEAPPGVGKSGIAMTLLSSVNNGYLITSTKQLQDQYIKDFSDDYRYDIESIKGKKNYTCAINDTLKCDIGECINDKNMLTDCIDNNVCPYYKQKMTAQYSKIALTTYQYFLTFADSEQKMSSRSSTWKYRDMVIFDEAHLLEQQIINWASISIEPKKLSKELHIFKNCDMQQLVRIFNLPKENGFIANRDWICAVMDCIRDTRENILNEIKESLKNENTEDLTEDEIEQLLSSHSEYNELDILYKKFNMFFKSDKKEWIVEVIDGGLILTPINVSSIFDKYIKRWGNQKIVFMSATILDHVGFCKSFGIDINDAFFVKAESEFDPKKSPIIYNPVGKMNYENIDKILPDIAKNVKLIIDKHKGEKGIIHTTNYKITKYIYENVETDRFIIKNNDITNEDMIRMHEESNNDTILLSPSLTTGADLKDDLGRFSIIVKLPWPSLMDSRVKEKIKQDDNWLCMEMFKTFIQTCGRTTRSENDWSKTYVFDQSFSYWVLKYRKVLGKKFLERIQWK